MPSNQFFPKVNIGLADIINGGIFMNDPINHIAGVFNNSLHQMFQSRIPQDSLTDSKANNQDTSHKYRIENNLIVYEKYDRHGRLISTVPWSSRPIDQKA